MTSGLTVAWHDPTRAAPPPGWAEFVTTARLPGMWDWPIVHAVAASKPMPVLAATVHDGPQVQALVTARFPGLRPDRRAAPLAGVVDVDCLASGSQPGIALAGDADAALRAETVAVLREALRHEYGRRVRAVLFRQVGIEWLAAVLRWPALVREGGAIAVFRNRFTDFDGYLAGLRKSRRWSLRKAIRELDADPQVAVSFTGRGDPPALLAAAEVCALQAKVVDRHHRRWWLRKRRMHPAVARAELVHPGVHRLTYHRATGQLLGFGLVWDHPELPLSGAWGSLAPAGGGRKDLWFHHQALLVRWCIETGRAGLVTGQGSLAEKLRLGHELSRQWAVLVPHRHHRSGR